MPYTPIHGSVAYLARRLNLTANLPALLVSTMAPDLEIPVIYVATSGQYSRLVLHSLLGAVLLSTLLSVFIVVHAYAPVVAYLFRIDYKTAKDRCRFSWGMVAICSLGGLSHVLIDSLHHAYNPLFYPFTLGSFDALVFMNDWRLASVVIPSAFLSLLIIFVVIEVEKGTKDIWSRLLLE